MDTLASSRPTPSTSAAAVRYCTRLSVAALTAVSRVSRAMWMAPATRGSRRNTATP